MLYGLQTATMNLRNRLDFEPYALLYPKES
jgi:hypothetical protein